MIRQFECALIFFFFVLFLRARIYKVYPALQNYSIIHPELTL